MIKKKYQLLYLKKWEEALFCICDIQKQMMIEVYMIKFEKSVKKKLHYKKVYIVNKCIIKIKIRIVSFFLVFIYNLKLLNITIIIELDSFKLWDFKW